MSNEVGSLEWRRALLSKRGRKEWQKEVLALLEPDELSDNYPTTDGLARITRLIFGEFYVDVVVAKAPAQGDRMATVNVMVSTATHIDGFPPLRICSSADATEYNTKAPYNKHLVATAETKAFGRALKRLLAINIHTKEEMLDDETSYEKITDQQIRAIENLTKKFKIDLDAFLVAHAGIDADTLKSGNSGLSREHGVALLTTLNDINNEKLPSP